MAENTGNNPAGSTDSTSFASILAGVQRMRNEASGSVEVVPQQQQQQLQQQSSTAPVQRREPAIGSKRVNTFNQDRSTLESTSRTLNRGVVKPSNLSVNKSQTGNPLLKHITNVNWSYVEARNPYDYQVNGRQIIFLSLKYHKLHPEYIGNKMKALVKKNAILLTVVDVENTETILKEINKICLFNEFTLLLAFTFEQAAKYLTSLATSPTSAK